MLNLRLVQPARLVDVRKIQEMTAVDRDGEALILGGCVTHSNIEDGKAPDIANGMMARVAAGIACRAVRNRGTIGGSIANADPAAEYPAVILALDASLKALSVRGAREIPAEEFFVGPEIDIERMTVLRCMCFASLGS